MMTNDNLRSANNETRNARIVNASSGTRRWERGITSSIHPAACRIALAKSEAGVDESLIGPQAIVQPNAVRMIKLDPGPPRAGFGGVYGKAIETGALRKYG